MGYREESSLLNQLTIQVVGSLLGLRLPLTGHIHCPFPDHDDRTPSFQVKKPGNRWICYGCDRRGGAIDFVKVYHGTNFMEAKRWLADRVDTVRPGTPPARDHVNFRTTGPKPLPMADEAVEPPPDHVLYEALLRHAPLQPNGLRYLLSRGLTEPIISASRVGQLSNCSIILEHLIREYGYQRVKTAGLLAKSSTSTTLRLLFPKESLIFPFLENEQIAYLQVRLLSKTEAKGKWRNLNRRKRHIYNVDTILRSSRKPFAICEGVMDTLSAIELGYNAIGLLGVSTQLNANQVTKLRDRQVDILLDWDPAGNRRSAELQKQLRRFGIASTRKRQPAPGVKDLNDYLISLRKCA